MFKFVLMTGVFLGSLAGISGGVQAAEEKGLTEQVQGSTLHVNHFRTGDRVWVPLNLWGGTTVRMYGTVIKTACGGSAVNVEFDNSPGYNKWYPSDSVYPA